MKKAVIRYLRLLPVWFLAAFLGQHVHDFSLIYHRSANEEAYHQGTFDYVAVRILHNKDKSSVNEFMYANYYWKYRR